MPLTNTPLRYPGGKSKYARMMAEIILLNKLEGCTFVEVYAGGAGAAISLLLKGKVKSLFLNDLDIAIYSFWKSVIERPEELIRMVKDAPVCVKEWEVQKKVYDTKGLGDSLALGFATFYLNRSNRSGILQARPIGGMKQTGSYKIDARFNKETAILKIREIAKHADSISVSNLDGEAYLAYLAREHRSSNLLIYLDPPYYVKGPGLYLNHLDHNDHKSLSKSIQQCPFPWVLSYDNNEEIRKFYKEASCDLYVQKIRHTISGNQKAQELIVSKLKMPAYLSATSRVGAIQ